MAETDQPLSARLSRAFIFSSLVGALCGLFTAAFMALYGIGTETIWKQYVPNHDMPLYAGIFIAFIASALIVLFRRNLPEGPSAEEEFASTGGISFTHFFRTLGVAVVSLFSGASVGPEGGLAQLAGQFATYIRTKLSVSEAFGRVLVFAGVAATFSAFLGSPVIGTFLVMEMYHYKKYDYDTWALPALLASGMAFVIYWILLGEATIKVFDFPEYTEPHVRDLIAAIPLALAGVVIAEVFGFINRQIVSLLSPLHHRLYVRGVIGFAAIVLAMIFFPIVLFSGHDEIHTLIIDGAEISVGVLLIILIGKMLLTSVSFATIFKGGPIFPLIFLGTAGGLLVHALFSSISIPVAIISIVTGTLTVSMRLPISVILLVTLTSGIVFTPIIVMATFASYAAIIVMAPIEKRTEMLRIIPA